MFFGSCCGFLDGKSLYSANGGGNTSAAIRAGCFFQKTVLGFREPSACSSLSPCDPRRELANSTGTVRSNLAVSCSLFLFYPLFHLSPLATPVDCLTCRQAFCGTFNKVSHCQCRTMQAPSVHVGPDFANVCSIALALARHRCHLIH